MSLALAGLCLLSIPLHAPAQPPPLAWVQRYQGPAQHLDAPDAITSDSAGNVYVAGSSLSEYNDDFVTIKYSSAGVPLWTNRFDGQYHSDDQPMAVAVDNSGGVFVTGPAYPGSETVKYSAGGTPLWTNFDAAGVFPYVMTLDHAGNLVIGGTFNLDNTNFLGVSELSSAGISLWTNFTSLPTNAVDISPTAIAVDPNDNIFLTATTDLESNSNGTYYFLGEAIEIAAVSSNGALLWTNFYQAAAGSYDTAVALAISGSGNVVVAGTSSDSLGISSVVTLEYSPGGANLWTTRLEGSSSLQENATAVTVDNSGNVFVAGFEDDVSGFPYTSPVENNTLIKYSGAGVQRWINRLQAYATYMAVTADTGGRIFLTGGPSSYLRNTFPAHTSTAFESFEFSTFNFLVSSNYCILSFDPSDYGVFITQQSNGNAFVTGAAINAAGEPEMETAALLPGSGISWTNLYTGPGVRNFNLSGLAVDTNGNAIVTGYSSASQVKNQYSTLGFSAPGQPLWTNLFSVASSLDPPSSGISDGRGNLVVTGLGTTVNDSPYATISYSPAGHQNWTNNPVPPPSTNFPPPPVFLRPIYSPLPLCADANGDIFISGQLFSGNFSTVRLSSTGTALWTNNFSNSNFFCSPGALAADAAGDVFITGPAYPSGNLRGSSIYSFTAACSAAGSPMWINFSPTNTAYGNHAIGVAPNGTVIVAETGNTYFGTNLFLSGPNQIQVIAYSPAGIPLWTNNSAVNSTSNPNALAIDSAGNAIVTGSSYSHGFMTLKLSPTGVPLWTNFSTATDSGATAIALDRLGNIYVTGDSYSPATGYDITTIAYSSSGLPLWTNRYNGPDSGDDFPVAIAVNGGDVYVAGTSTDSDGSSEYVLLKYSANLQAAPLKIAPMNAGAVLTWTNSLFGLQSATSPGGPFTDILGASSPYTNPPSGPAQYFRLRSP